jgi:hypothetical protein
MSAECLRTGRSVAGILVFGFVYVCMRMCVCVYVCMCMFVRVCMWAQQGSEVKKISVKSYGYVYLRALLIH